MQILAAEIDRLGQCRPPEAFDLGRAQARKGPTGKPHQPRERERLDPRIVVSGTDFREDRRSAKAPQRPSPTGYRPYGRT